MPLTHCLQLLHCWMDCGHASDIYNGAFLAFSILELINYSRAKIFGQGFRHPFMLSSDKQLHLFYGCMELINHSWAKKNLARASATPSCLVVTSSIFGTKTFRTTFTCFIVGWIAVCMCTCMWHTMVGKNCLLLLHSLPSLVSLPHGQSLLPSLASLSHG